MRCMHSKEIDICECRLKEVSERPDSFLFYQRGCCLQMYKYRRTDFIETNLKPMLVESCSHQMALIDSSLTQFTRHRDRLKVVREQKRKQTLEMDVIGQWPLPYLLTFIYVVFPLILVSEDESYSCVSQRWREYWMISYLHLLLDLQRPLSEMVKMALKVTQGHW